QIWVRAAQYGCGDDRLSGKRLAAQLGLSGQPYRADGDAAKIGREWAGSREVVQSDAGIVIFQASADQVTGDRNVSAAAPHAAATNLHRAAIQQSRDEDAFGIAIIQAQ